MKELDFDELDRAVNSLMTGMAKKQPDSQDTPNHASDATPPTDETKDSSSSIEVPVKNRETESVPVSSSPPSPSPSLPFATRRGGRFMDVVRPSADMKKQVPGRPISRQGVTIEPQIPPLSSLSTSIPSEHEEEEQTVATPKPASPFIKDHVAPENEWPDPLDMASFKDDTSLPDKPVEEDKQKLEEPDVATEPVLAEQPSELPPPEEPKDPTLPDDKTDYPATSPFLPDAKVEKRPLGAATLHSAINEPKTTLIEDDDKSTTDTNDDLHTQLPALPKDVTSPLPDELQSELMAIEADTTTHTPLPEEPVKESMTQAEDEGVPEDSMPVSVPSSTPVQATTSSAEPKEAPLPAHGTISIPQQYREEPSSGNQESGAIYDTDTYHQPLTHPPKQKSGWLWVVWIVVILLLGAGGGAALYFLGVV